MFEKQPSAAKAKMQNQLGEYTEGNYLAVCHENSELCREEEEGTKPNIPKNTRNALLPPRAP